jgi:hypothetical protein
MRTIKDKNAFPKGLGTGFARATREGFPDQGSRRQRPIWSLQRGYTSQINVMPSSMRTGLIYHYLAISYDTSPKQKTGHSRYPPPRRLYLSPNLTSISH